ncbi:MAG: type II toxin-antitoxin system VapC family toxin [Verrucomicrobia bacterium]|jgi:tRNA(fMet)-specific endonuclease VapC|nr:type II toxin-antitoxin system VapC family toxin [Verrucomicrobiota bacterium]MBT7064962.1 type II toxin-antitoxin system VapC family toxin [Verrucomicrobiota bacterium]MBT7702069.1 type II toxin-antitoxin system VapC family toxin [Verrucomicrobiota bacterium]
MRIAIDTNRYRDFCEGDAKACEVLQSADRILMPLPVLAELRAGFACGTLARQNERVLSIFLDRPRVAMLMPDEQTTFHYGRLYAQLRNQGSPVPTNALWIAALVIQHRLMLFTRDDHFKHLPQIPCV